MDVFLGMPNISIQDRAEEVSSNTLPPQFRTWLDFYDSISPENQQDPKIKWAAVLTADEYYARYNLWPHAINKDHCIILSGEIDRDFMLARIAERLLPTRFDKNELDRLRREQYTSDGYKASAGYREMENLFEILSTVSRRK